MASEQIGQFTESAARRVWEATKRVEQQPMDLRPAPRRRPPQTSSSGGAVLHGRIAKESAEGEDDNYTDNRYHVQLGNYADDGDAPLTFVANGTTVTATNAHENTTGWHALRVGTEVTLVAVTGGYKII